MGCISTYFYNQPEEMKHFSNDWIEFDYPASWNINQNNDSVTLSSQNNSHETVGYGVIITIQRYSQNNLDWITFTPEAYMDDQDQLYDNVTFNGMNVLNASYGFEENSYDKFIRIVLKKGDYIYEIRGPVTGTSPQLESSISTFLNSIQIK